MMEKRCKCCNFAQNFSLNMYQINENLIRRIHKMLGISQRRFSEETFTHNQVWPQRMTFFDRMLLSDLITISNRWHIPMRYLICEDTDACDFLNISDITVQGAWEDVHLDVEAFRRIYQSACARNGRNKLHEGLGVTASCVWRWITVHFTMRAQTLCDFCNITGVDFHDFVKDTNLKALPKKSVPEVCVENVASPAAGHPVPPALKAEGVLESLTRLQSENIVLSASVRSLRQQMEQMRAMLLTLNVLSKDASSVQTKEILRATGFAGCDGVCSPYGWQGEAWGDGVPTLAQMVEQCNAQQCATSRFLVLPVVASDFASSASSDDASVFHPIALDVAALRFVMEAAGCGVAEAGEVSVLDFCDALNRLHLTPASCIDDANAGYPNLFADRMVRKLAGRK